MPFMDGTGPLGNGPGTGRRRGPCAGGQRGVGRGMGLGRGRGAGSGPGFGQQQALGAGQDRKAVLEEQAGFLERQLERVKRQLSGLGGEPPSK